MPVAEPVATPVTLPPGGLKLRDSLPLPRSQFPMHQFKTIRRLALGAALAGAATVRPQPHGGHLEALINAERARSRP
jgi:hypothetical protein